MATATPDSQFNDACCWPSVPCNRLALSAVCCLCRDLPRGLQVVGQAINGLAEQAQVNPAGSVLHVAVCNGSDALAVSDGAAKLLASGTNLLGSVADDQFSSMELLGSDGPHGSTATPKGIAQVLDSPAERCSLGLHRCTRVTGQALRDSATTCLRILLLCLAVRVHVNPHMPANILLPLAAHVLPARWLTSCWRVSLHRLLPQLSRTLPLCCL